MKALAIYILLVWPHLLLYVDGARKEQKGMLSVTKTQEETTSLRRKAKNDGQQLTGSAAKVSLWQDPYIPVHSVNAMTTTTPGHRPRAFVVAGILIMLILTLLGAIFVTIHRKVSEEVGAPLRPPPTCHASPGFAVKTLKAQAPGDIRRVEDEIAELTKELTPPTSPGVAHQPEPCAKPEPTVEPSVETAIAPENCEESSCSDFPATPSRAKFSDRVHPALGEAPLPTPPPRSPPKGNRRKRCKVDEDNDVSDPAMPPKTEVAAALSSDLRNLDDEFAELTQDLFLPSPSNPFQHAGPGISAQDFADVRTLRAVSFGELRSHHDEVTDLIQDLLPSSNRSSPLGELRSVQEEISELEGDLHAKEPEMQV